jgi:hypothetical protein
MIVQRQVNAANAKKHRCFLESYADSVEVYTFPDKLQGKSKETIRGMSNFFKQVSDHHLDLHYEIKPRLVHGDTVIDNEHVIVNGKL